MKTDGKPWKTSSTSTLKWAYKSYYLLHYLTCRQQGELYLLEQWGFIFLFVLCSVELRIFKWVILDKLKVIPSYLDVYFKKKNVLLCWIELTLKRQFSILIWLHWLRLLNKFVSKCFSLSQSKRIHLCLKWCGLGDIYLNKWLKNEQVSSSNEHLGR